MGILSIAVGSLSAMEGEQKTENYGYFETNETIVTSPVEETISNAKVSNSLGAQLIGSNSSSKKETVGTVVEAETPSKKDLAADVDHSAFDALLKTYVSNGGDVDYAGIKSQVATLDKYLGFLSQNVPTSGSNKNEVLAFWINAYNANTIKLIVDNYPVASIMDLYGGKAFDKKWITIGGESLSLNDIENNKIRAKFNEPRIHFAVNCAAKSCPPLLNKAWTADNVQSNLESRALAFVNNSTYNKLSSAGIQISKIFEWYAKDFPVDIISYINKFSKTKVEVGSKVSYIEYDWALNNK